jgi:hypothetical protein
MSNVVPLKPNPAGRRRVLVVEDNLDAVHSMAMLKPLDPVLLEQLLAQRLGSASKDAANGT